MGEFEKMAKDASAVGLVSLSRKWFETDSNKDVREIDVLEDKRGADPVREIQRKDLKELMTKGLSRAERLIIVLYYFEEMTMKEIGSTLDLSESRVSQMHSSILAQAALQMADRKRNSSKLLRFKSLRRNFYRRGRLTDHAASFRQVSPRRACRLGNPGKRFRLTNHIKSILYRQFNRLNSIN